MSNYFLGFDTSNYKTSIACVSDKGEILASIQEFLEVKLGERGLRQSDALFQHVVRLPERTDALIRDLPEGVRENIRAIGVSTRPRPVEGSYMPVFQAGYLSAKVMAAGMGIPLYTFSHQEGHIEAVRFGTPLEQEKRFVTFHFSGGTTEAILVDETGEHPTYNIVGGSRDISYGQLLDRIGVALGMGFPSGQEMDEIAMSAEESHIRIPQIKVKDGWINLSGIETACQRLIGSVGEAELIRGIFQEITRSIGTMTKQIAKQYNVGSFLYAGGVSSSRFVREHLTRSYDIYFGDPSLSSDNAVGIALLGGKQYGLETGHGITANGISFPGGGDGPASL